ncbi:MAG TPA: HTH-type transcriptional activator IlvY [Alteromonas australica]|jgi:LysR family transcriptional regulator, positive regulator for ilvC|uniref:HTH-type transcriptional activator IlvY n=1 Tax=Alteromonas australica TaxID=589873 RepID=A0A075P119_9ALTE|nr:MULTISPECIES: HTH-type transcriptional activator IlvY [Alteromonas]MAB93829.1 HTH-type transcriptional activator IlvY [Alteromonas sp.]AIG00585.1 transcriptional regulator [Alteromonas australica]AJP45434.1 transcriptional regulator [Alteromonas australica]MAF69090.1 HTH-type transcriptional activator IlvY [Alteromonas sp.]MAF72154.1 HTH-type transcriptional activator IlvY [Alteromonas sp.]|tara:strand:+ start:9199 stop:10071 length:873 start_codon:yes stop_codon:yes gene_type:complete
MDFRSLQLFKHLATSLHFGDTAEAMYVSPSTLSRVIQRLEDELGCTLFKRDNRKVALTHSGHKLLSFSTQALKDWQQLKADLKEDTEALQGEISLFCSVTASQSHLPAILRQFRQQHPGVDIRLITGDPALSIEKIKQKQCDLAIAIHTPDLPTDLYFSPLDNVPLVLIAPREWRLTQLAQINWTQHQVIMPEHGPTRRIAYHWFAEHGVRPNVYASVGGNEAIVSMVALECGIGFVPKVVLDHSSMASLVTQIAVEDIEPYALGLCCLQDKQQEPLIDAFLKLDFIPRG